MKKTVIFILMALSCMFFACNKHSINLFATNMTLHIGEERRISATSPAKITFSSADNSVATVNETGLVKAIGEGCTSITLSSDNESKEIIVRVIPDNSIAACQNQCLMTPTDNNTSIKTDFVSFD